MLRRTVQTQSLHYLQQGALEGRDPSPNSVVSGTLSIILMCERLGSLPWSTTCALELPKVRRPSPTDEAANPKQSVAEAQKEWDKPRSCPAQQLPAQRRPSSIGATENPTVSIYLFFYNKAHLSLLCLDSILDNADVPYEVVIVNNCSKR